MRHYDGKLKNEQKLAQFPFRLVSDETVN